MLRSTTIIRELVQSLAKVILILKHSVKLCCYLLWGGVAACLSMAFVLCAEHTVHAPHWDMLPHHRITNNNIRGL